MSVTTSLLACGLTTFPGRVSLIFSVCSISDKQTNAQLNRYCAGNEPCFATAPWGTSVSNKGGKKISQKQTSPEANKVAFVTAPFQSCQVIFLWAVLNSLKCELNKCCALNSHKIEGKPASKPTTTVEIHQHRLIKNSKWKYKAGARQEHFAKLACAPGNFRRIPYALVVCRRHSCALGLCRLTSYALVAFLAFWSNLKLFKCLNLWIA